MEARQVSIVVPVFNEADSLELLSGEIREMAQQAGLAAEIVFVDDGSRDGSWARIAELAGADRAISGIRLRRNVGKTAVLAAGFAAARGEFVVMMDADLQDPPAEVPALIAKLDEGYDLVSGWKRIRNDPWHKVYPSRVFNRLVGWLTGVKLHDHVCGLKCFRREVARDFELHGDMHRFLGVLAAAKGYRVTEIPTIHRPRTHGTSKYGFTRFFKGFVDLLTVWFLTRFRWRPQHLIGVTGLVVILAGALLLAVAWAGRLLGWLDLGWWASIMVGVVDILVPGLILIAIGLVAELIVAGQPNESLYDVAERIGWCAREESDDA